MSEERHILVTNDDGIEAPGLWKLAEVMAEFGRVLVVAPATEASGAGTMVTYRRELQVQQVPERKKSAPRFAPGLMPAASTLIQPCFSCRSPISTQSAGVPSTM